MGNRDLLKPLLTLSPWRGIGHARIGRLQRARPGSVLILVIALLVLMALIGTAFISTTSVERYSATQNTYNTQVDLLVQGVLGMAQGAMTRKLQDSQGNFRTGSSATLNGSAATDQYHPWESPVTETYLADRVPSPILVPDPAQPGWGYAFWTYISAPLNRTSQVPTGQFEAPFAVDANGNITQAPVTYLTRETVLPWAMLVPQPDGSQKICPAFVVNPTNPKLLLADNQTPATLPIIVLAADTDGDGIADAGFMRLQGGQIEGATYYGAVRIIDNLAAINASVAMEPFNTGHVPAWPQNTAGGDFFPGNINLKDMLTGGESPSKLNAYRFNNGAANNGESFKANPIDDTGATHADYQFNTPYEAAWAQLGSRLNHPGRNASATNYYQAVPIDEGINMAYHFCLANQNASPSPVLETFLPNSTRSAIVDRGPYASNDPGGWWGSYFNYDQSGLPTMTLRPILVARNPVSNFTPSYFSDRGAWSSGAAYNFADRVQAGDTVTGQQRGFVCVRPNTNQAPVSGTSYNNAYWAPMPWTSHPTKINANTGTFGQLWTAYWSVMQDSPDSAGVYPNYTPTKANANPTWASDGQNDSNNQQFRNPIRNTSTVLTRSQVIQLRAALAAVNTIDMRDGDTDVTSRTIALTDMSGQPGIPHTLYANVYGSERQPYITELLIDYDPKNPDPAAPYVIIELYNPHPTPILMAGWKLASLARGGASISLTEVGDLSTTLNSATHAGGLTGPVILPGERIVLESDPANRPANIKDSLAANKVTPYANKSTATANLAAAVGHELVLLRPRVTPSANAPAGYTNVGTAPENTYNENNLVDLVPLDNIDLVGVAPGVPNNAPARYRYARANLIAADAGSAAWHCVYPGPYSAANSGAGGLFHHIGLWPVVARDPDPKMPTANNGGFGLPKGKFVGKPNQPASSATSAYAAFATYETRPLQINNLDHAGPNRPYREALTNGLPNGGVANFSNTKMSFPLGGFPRRGDLLSVPFIGSYVISSAPDPSANGAQVFEMNSVTMDSVLAQYQAPSTNVPLASAYDQDTTFGPIAAFHNEQIGHFCPMDVGSNDFNDDPTDPAFTANIQKFTYHWAKRLFDYLDVYTPQDAYLPNVDPSVTGVGVSGDPSVPNSSYKFPGAAATPLPTPVSSSPALAVTNYPAAQTRVQQLQGLQDTAGTEGQININSANWKVLSTVPFFPPGEDSFYQQDNATMGQQIWLFRETTDTNNATNPHAGYGPFRSIFDLMKVPIFKTYNSIWVTVTGSPGEVTNRYGDLSPFAKVFPTLGAEVRSSPSETDLTDHVYGDVKTRFLGLTRISNLVTTGSDSFTAYAQVQAWQNVGTMQPTLVATRRGAVLFDRTQVKPVRNNSTINALTPMGAVNVPND